MKIFEHIELKDNKTDMDYRSMSAYFMGLSPSNTISDVVTELYDNMFREILGDDTMDRALGSFSRQELFKVMSMIFLQDGNQKIYRELAQQD